MSGSVERVDGCLACDLASGRRPLPGGVIHETPAWLVEHCVGPLPLGTLIVKPRRHVTRVAGLDDHEAAAFGPLLRPAACAVDELVEPEQVYTCLWSHAGRTPVHIHWVVQPATTADIQRGDPPATADVGAFAERARAWFARSL